jgi:hypothetical protein
MIPYRNVSENEQPMRRKEPLGPWLFFIGVILWMLTAPLIYYACKGHW